MPKNEKLTESQLLDKLQKIAKNAENEVSYKYGGIAFFLDHLNKKGINAFDILQKAYNDAS
jgi:hypothetical protein